MVAAAGGGSEDEIIIVMAVLLFGDELTRQGSAWHTADHP